MPIDASGKGYVRPEVWEQFAKPLQWKQFIESADNKTLNLAIELSNIIYGAIEGVSFERAGIAVVDAMIGDYEKINDITGASISSKEEFDGFLKQLRGQRTGPGRPPGESDSRSYNKDDFWPAEAVAREKLADERPGKPLVKEIADKMGISEWLYHYYKRTYPR